MGWRDNVRANLKALSASPSVLEAVNDRHNFAGYLATGPGPYGQTNAAISQAQVELMHAAHGWMYRNVPAVRTVIDYIARNLAQLGLRLYEEGEDYSTKEVHDHPAIDSLHTPNPQTPGQHWVRQVVTAFLIYDDSFAIKFQGPNDTRQLFHLPTEMVGILGPDFFRASGYRIWKQDGQHTDRTPEEIIHWRGINPLDPRNGVSPMETLRKQLAEEAASQAATTELSKAGLAPPGYIHRPLDAPPLDNPDAERVLEAWRRSMQNPGRETAMLEEGMLFNAFGISPKDAEALAGRKFTLESVARMYGLSNVPCQTEEERQEFYQNVLAPLCEFICSFLDLQLLQQEYDADSLCLKFDIDEKLRGDPINRFSALTTAAGRPWLTVNEIREIEDREPIKGGDDLTIPSNVVLGGEGNPDTPQLPAPNVMPPQNPLGNPQDGSYREDGASTNGHHKASSVPRRAEAEKRRAEWKGKLVAALAVWFAAQRDSGGGGIKGDKLATALLALFRRHVDQEGSRAAFRMMGKFDSLGVNNYLEAKAQRVAEEIATQTQKDIEALGRDEAFTRAENVRIEGLAGKLATDNAAFAVKAAAEQVDGGERYLVRVHGGDCEQCAPYQGTWRIEDLKKWPGYHPHCDCMADLVS